jgi:cell wall-associated NlpC family hydrolase
MAPDPRQAIITYAVAQVGKPYVWGGTGPDSFDCSGLCVASYKNGAGITIPRVAAAQQSAGSSVDVAQLQPADLCFIGNPAFHVVMFIGNNEVVAADHTGVPVRTRAFNSSEFTGGFRSLANLPPDSGQGLGSSVLGSIPGVGAVDGLLHIAEGVNGVAMHLTSATFWQRIGKFSLGILIVVTALVIINRKRIEQAAGTATKAAAVIPK